MDLASLDRLSDQARRLAESTDEPLLKVFYWSCFLDLYLQSGVAAPVYLEDCLPGLVSAFEGGRLNLVDPILLDDIRRLAIHPQLPQGNGVPAFRRAVVEYRVGHAAGTPVGGRDLGTLDANVILVMKGRVLWNRVPVVGVPDTIQVGATRGFVAPGQISWRGRLVPGDAIQTVASEALAAALHVQGFKRPLLSYELRTRHPELPLVGSSLGLALALLFSAFESAERRKPHSLPSAEAAICGATDPTGVVLPASPATIRQKVRAATGAGFRQFVLPQANLADAQAEIDGLSRRLPELPLPRLVPLRHLSDALAEPGVAVAPQRPVRRTVRRVRPFPIIVTAVLALLAVVWVLFLMPRRWAAERTSVEIRGEARLTVAAKLQGFPPREKQWTFASMVTRAIVTSLHPTSSNALLVATGESGSTPACLFCYDVTSGKLLWTRDFTHPAPLPKETMAGNRTHVSELIATDLDGDGSRDIILTVLATPQSPCFVIWLDARGERKAIYAHRGYLFRLTAEDLWIDGSPEIYLTGTSNSDDRPYSQRATLVVLDRDHFAGWPDGGPFTGSEIAPYDSCLARVIFPPIPEHCQIYDAPGYYVTHFTPCPSREDPRVMIGLGTCADPGLVVTLDGFFHPVQVLAEDGIAPIVQRAMKAGRIDSDFTTVARLHEYQGEIRRVR